MALDADAVIIGASAAGLATAACLKQTGRSFEILEATEVVGNTWRHHYDRLHLHTPKSGSALPGLKMPREWPRYPARDQVVDYLQHYRARHGSAPATTRRSPGSSVAREPGSPPAGPVSGARATS